MSQVLELAISCCTQMMWTKGVKDVLDCFPIFDKRDVGKSSVTWRSSHFQQPQSPDHAVQETRPAGEAANRERRLILDLGSAWPAPAAALSKAEPAPGGLCWGESEVLRRKGRGW